MMLILVLHILLVCYFTGFHCQVNLEESGGDVVKAGCSLRLTCKTSGFDFGPGTYAMNWVRQQSGKGLEWVAYHYSGTDDTDYIYYSPSVKARFTISRDVPQSLLFLDTTNLNPEDTGMYYCARGGGYWGHSVSFDYWGKGTHLTVTPATPGEPSLLSISPCCNIPASQNPLQIGCFVTSDSPSKKIQWFKGSSQISANVKQYPEVYNNGRYSFSSVLNVNSADWNTYECRFDSQTEHLKKRGCGCPEKNPEIELYMASCNPDDTKAMYLLCRVSSFLPEDIEVAWFKGARTPIIDFIFTGNKTEVNPCFFHTVSRVKITAEEWSTGIHFTCLVTQSGKPFQKEISSCSAF